MPGVKRDFRETAAGLPGVYPIDLSEEIERIDSGTYGPFDEQGLPLVDYEQWYRKNGLPTKGQQFPIAYTPVTIAHFGLGRHQPHTATKEPEDKRRFLASAAWLIGNLKEVPGKFWVWEHHFPMPVYRLTPPWPSAMAQGEGMSLLLRAYEETKQTEFLTSAHRAFQAFLFPLNQGGVTYFDEDGRVWFEEYPSDPPSHVLNGMIFALIGIYEFWSVTADPSACRLFESGILTLQKRLNDFDAGYGSRYDLLTKRVVGEKYHRIHIAQMRLLFDWTGEELFEKMANRWEAVWNNPIARVKRAVLPRLTAYWMLLQVKRVLGI